MPSDKIAQTMHLDLIETSRSKFQNMEDSTNGILPPDTFYTQMAQL